MDEKIAKSCPARHSCKQHNILCGSGCPLWVELRYQTEMSAIPKRHRKFTVDNLPSDTVNLKYFQKFYSKILERVESGLGIYLFGNTGSGKTTALSALAMSYIVEGSKKAIKEGSRTEQMVLFLNVPDLLTGLKRGFEDPEVAKVWHHKLDVAKSVPLLVLDDIGSERPGEWVRERLTELIGHRYDNELSTLISSNLTLPELKDHIDPVGRITSRIKGMAIPLEHKGKDRRNIL
jgi:DNA replication protein DnaC